MSEIFSALTANVIPISDVRLLLDFPNYEPSKSGISITSYLDHDFDNLGINKREVPLESDSRMLHYPLLRTVSLFCKIADSLALDIMRVDFLLP